MTSFNFLLHLQQNPCSPESVCPQMPPRVDNDSTSAKGFPPGLRRALLVVVLGSGLGVVMALSMPATPMGQDLPAAQRQVLGITAAAPGPRR